MMFCSLENTAEYCTLPLVGLGIFFNTEVSMGPKVRAGKPVTGANFYGRETSVRKFWREIDNGNNLLLVSPRRLGKTSLMRHIEANPEDGWTVVFTNLEGKTSAVSAISEIISQLRQKGGLGERIASSFLKSLDGAEVSGFGISAKIRKAASDDWDNLSAEFEKAIANATKDDDRLILIVDEFPIIIEKLFSNPETAHEAVSLLQLFRKIRTDTNLDSRFRMVVGGSIGLKPILRRHKATADANDLKSFRIGPWTKKIALAFMKEIGDSGELVLSEDLQMEVLKRTGENPIPYHLQTVLDGLIGLEKYSDELSVDDVEAVWRTAIGDVELDHYRERLSSVLDGDEVVLAEEILAKIVEDGPQPRSVLTNINTSVKAAKAALRMLLEDGYLVETPGDDPVIDFANPMLAEFWRLY